MPHSFWCHWCLWCHWFHTAVVLPIVDRIDICPNVLIRINAVPIAVSVITPVPLNHLTSHMVVHLLQLLSQEFRTEYNTTPQPERIGGMGCGVTSGVESWERLTTDSLKERTVCLHSTTARSALSVGSRLCLSQCLSVHMSLKSVSFDLILFWLFCLQFLRAMKTKPSFVRKWKIDLIAVRRDKWITRVTLSPIAD